MRMNEKGHSVTNGANQLFNVNFHDFISKSKTTLQWSLLLNLAFRFKMLSV